MKTKVDKLDVDEVFPVSNDLSELSDVVKKMIITQKLMKLKKSISDHDHINTQNLILLHKNFINSLQKLLPQDYHKQI